MGKLTKLTAVLVVLAAGVAISADLLEDIRKDQLHRDLLRNIADLYVRSHAVTAEGEMVRPEFATPRISLPDINQLKTEDPNCDWEVVIEPTENMAYPRTLVLIPIDLLSESGDAFKAFAFFRGEAVVTNEAFNAAVSPDILGEGGGFPDRRDDFQSTLGPYDITVTTVECGAFSYAIIEGVWK